MPKQLQSGNKQVVIFTDKEYKGKFGPHAHIMACNCANDLAEVLSERYNRVKIEEIKDGYKVTADQQKGYSQ